MNSSSSEEAETSKKHPPVYKVIILGAGMAGLSAASHLIKNKNTNFLILEARNRIGGRISVFQNDNLKVELGANWIHGVLGNPMYEVAMANGLINIVNIPKQHSVVASTEDGHQVPHPILQEIYEAYICFLHRCEEYFLSQYLPPEDIHSVGEHINLEIQLYLQNVVSPEERYLRHLIFQCLLKRETCITGCNSMEDIDLLELGSYTELQGGNISLPSGYSSILEPISRNIPPEKVLLSHKVVSIRWKDKYRLGHIKEEEDGAESDDSDKTVIECNTDEHCDNRVASAGDTPANDCDHIVISCDNGQTFHTESIICTLPLGVLQSQDKLFTPSLPKTKRDSMQRLLFGTVNKIFLVYQRPFLEPNLSEILLLWNDSPEEEQTGKKNLSETWFKKIYSFAKVSETLLLAWISGEEAEYMESLSDEVISDTCTNILRKFLNDPLVPKPKQCICSRWKTDEFTQGSYTAMAVGASQLDIADLAQPICVRTVKGIKPVIAFAGEHTHSNFYSTVHGAYLTGRTAAQLLLSHLFTENAKEEVIVCEETDMSAWIQGMVIQ